MRVNDLVTAGEPDTSKGVRPVRRGDVRKPAGETRQGAAFLPNRNYAGVAQKHYGYNISVIDLRNPARSDGANMIAMVNRYIDLYAKQPDNLSLKAKAEKYAKIIAKTIIESGSVGGMEKGQNAYFYDSAEGILTSTILLIAEFCPRATRSRTNTIPQSR